MLILTVDGQPFVQCVALDDETDPGYIEFYVQQVRRYLHPSLTLRWAHVDVSTVAEYGPNDIAGFLTELGQAEHGITDLPQKWQTLLGEESKAWGIFDPAGRLKRVLTGDRCELGELAADESARVIDLRDYAAAEVPRT